MWTNFFRKSKFSQFLFPEKFGTLKIANMQSFCSGVYIRHDHLQNMQKKIKNKLIPRWLSVTYWQLEIPVTHFTNMD